MGVIKVDTRSLDYSLYRDHPGKALVHPCIDFEYQASSKQSSRCLVSALAGHCTQLLT